MGCCFSTDESSSYYSTENRAPSICRARDPPPGPEEEEEETVKEVLSETPRTRTRARSEQGGVEVGMTERDADLRVANGCDERSEDASDMGSVSETVSASTTVTDKRGDAGEGRPRSGSPAKLQKKRSASGELYCKRERCGAGGGGRSSPSPVRRKDGGTIGRTMSAREAGLRSRVPVEGAYRRDPGDRSGRRSVSPAAKREQRLIGGQCRSLSAPRADGRASSRRMPPRRGLLAPQDAYEGGSSEGKESLENPLVSLECFIFL